MCSVLQQLVGGLLHAPAVACVCHDCCAVLQHLLATTLTHGGAPGTPHIIVIQPLHLIRSNGVQRCGSFLHCWGSSCPHACVSCHTQCSAHKVRLPTAVKSSTMGSAVTVQRAHERGCAAPACDWAVLFLLAGCVLLLRAFGLSLLLLARGVLQGPCWGCGAQLGPACRGWWVATGRGRTGSAAWWMAGGLAWLKALGGRCP